MMVTWPTEGGFTLEARAGTRARSTSMSSSFVFKCEQKCSELVSQTVPESAWKGDLEHDSRVVRYDPHEMWKQLCPNKEVGHYVIGCVRAFQVFFTTHSCCRLATMMQQLTYIHVKKEPENFSLF